MTVKTRYQLKITILCIGLILINIFVLTRKNEAQGTLAKESLVVGMELKFPPFETIDDKGNPTGISVELAQAIGDKLGKEIEIKSLDWAGLIPALQTQNIDIILSSMSITEERLQTIDFSDEYAKSELGLAVHKSASINNYEALNERSYTVAVKQGTMGEMWAIKHLPNANLKTFTEVSAALLDVNMGQSTAFIYDPLSLIEGTKSLSQIKLLLDPLPEVEGWGIGMRQGEEALGEAINKALKAIKEEGFFEEMRKKYLKEEVEKYESYGLDYFF